MTEIRKFKVGDKVKGVSNIGSAFDLGVIVEVDEGNIDPYLVEYTVTSCGVWRGEGDLELAIDDSIINYMHDNLMASASCDAVNHPTHYTSYPGIEVIDLIEHLNFNRGSAIKYIARAGLKNKDTEIEDLKKSLWYIQREIERLEK